MAAFIAVCFIAVMMAIGRPRSILNSDIMGRTLIVLLLAILSVAVIGRVPTVDTYRYLSFFEYSSVHDLQTVLQVSAYDRLWTVMQWTVSQVSGSSHVFLGAVWAVFVTGLMVFLRRLFEPWQAAFVMFSYAVYPFLYSYATNTVRQGVAIALILVCVSGYIRRSGTLWGKVLLMTVATLFHWSALPFSLVSFAMARFMPRMRHLLGVWSVLAAVYVVGLQESLLGQLVSWIPRLDIYTSYQTLSSYPGVNRLDFLLFGGFWMVVGVMACRFMCREQAYCELVKYYIAWNSLFLLFGFVAYSDRLAAYSWLMVPALLWYPVLKKDRYSIGLTIVLVVLSIGVSIWTGTLQYLAIT